MVGCTKTLLSSLPSSLHTTKRLLVSPVSASTSPVISKVHHLLRVGNAVSHRTSISRKFHVSGPEKSRHADIQALTAATNLSGSTGLEPLDTLHHVELLARCGQRRRIRIGTPRATSAIESQSQASKSQHHKSVADLEGYLKRVADCNVGRERIRGPEFLELQGNGLVYGFIHKSFTEQLCDLGDTFRRQQNANSDPSTIELNPELRTFEARTEAVAAVCSKLKDRGAITGWRDEMYPVSTGFHDPPFFNLERAAAPHFGITAYGVHMNGYTEDADGNIHLWVARRSATKQTWPGRLDHLVAGGQPFGLSCADNLVKECQEEAGIRPELARRAISAGVVTYETVVENRAKRDVLFVYDLKLPPDFEPVNEDGEVETFELWPLARVAETIRTSTEYKPNVALVIIDFLVRHGFITPDQRRYLDLLSSLRTGSFISTRS